MHIQLQQAIKNVFVQISDSLSQLTNTQYSMPSKLILQASIGQHVRHIIELFICLNEGYETGVVNYSKRKRDYSLETDKDFATESLHKIYSALLKEDKTLVLEESYDADTDELVLAATNYYREIVYNLEHTIHHMAMIRVAISELPSIKLPEGFGVASSTIKFRQARVQQR